MYFIYLFLAVLGLCCCTRAFCSCCKWGLLFVEVHWLLIAVVSLVVEHRLQVHGLQQLWLTGSRAQAQQLWHTGLVAPWHVGSSRTRDRTCVRCIGRWTLNNCTTREVPSYVYFYDLYSSSSFFQACSFFFLGPFLLVLMLKCHPFFFFFFNIFIGV